MTYIEELTTFEWRQKRIQILARDSNKCQACGKKRSEFIGISSAFGLKTSVNLINTGFSVVIDKNLKKVKVLKNNYEFPCQLLLSASEEIISEKLFFARKWNEPKHKFVFGSYGFLCFDLKPIDDDYLDLNIHHKYYKQGRKAWEYEDNALITLCVDCHKMEHDNERTPVLNDMEDILFYTQKCDRCGGRGVLPEFKYVKNGMCFKCLGRGDLNF